MGSLTSRNLNSLSFSLMANNMVILSFDFFLPFHATPYIDVDLLGKEGKLFRLIHIKDVSGLVAVTQNWQTLVPVPDY